MESYETDTQIDLTKTIFFSGAKNKSRKRTGPLFFVVRGTLRVEVFLCFVKSRAWMKNNYANLDDVSDSVLLPMFLAP